MKKYFIPLVLLFFFLSCDKDVQENAVQLNASELVGSWQIVSESYSIGGPQIENAVESGGIYNFGLDSSFTFVYEKDTSRNFAGTFTFEEEILTLNYIRDNEDAYWELRTTFENDLVTFVPIGPTICIEGCSTTLRRID